MNRKTKYLAPVLALGLIGFGAGSVSAENTTVTVESGDTLWSIAQQYKGLTVDDLYEMNPGIDADDIQVGSEITISSGGDYSDNPNEEFHTVEPGSTLYSIANLHEGVTLDELYDMNPGINPNNLQIGSEVRVSWGDDAQPEEMYHTVRPGSTLYSIANLHKGVTLEELYELNPGIDPLNLQIGSQVKVR